MSAANFTSFHGYFLTLFLGFSLSLLSWALFQQYFIPVYMKFVLGIGNILPIVDYEFGIFIRNRLGVSMAKGLTACFSLLSHGFQMLENDFWGWIELWDTATKPLRYAIK